MSFVRPCGMHLLALAVRSSHKCSIKALKQMRSEKHAQAALFRKQLQGDKLARGKKWKKAFDGCQLFLCEHRGTPEE